MNDNVESIDASLEALATRKRSLIQEINDIDITIRNLRIQRENYCNVKPSDESVL